MNPLYSCSWAQNVKPVDLSTRPMKLNEAVLNEVRAAPEYARIMGLNSVRNLNGTMTPRFFATKVLRSLARDYPEKTIADITDDELLETMNRVAALSRKLMGNQEKTFDLKKRKDMPKPEESFIKGDSGLETLELNLDPETEFKYKEDAAGGAAMVYIAKKDGLNYRVTLHEVDEDLKSFKLKDLPKHGIVSVVVTDPKHIDTIDIPAPAGLGATTQRERPIADFPGEGEGDYTGPDPEAVDSSGEDLEDDDEAYDDEDEESTQMQKRPHIELVSGTEYPDRENPVPLEHPIKMSVAARDRLMRNNLRKRVKHGATIERKHNLYY